MQVGYLPFWSKTIWFILSHAPTRVDKTLNLSHVWGMKGVWGGLTQTRTFGEGSLALPFSSRLCFLSRPMWSLKGWHHLFSKHPGPRCTSRPGALASAPCPWGSAPTHADSALPSLESSVRWGLKPPVPTEPTTPHPSRLRRISFSATVTPPKSWKALQVGVKFNHAGHGVEPESPQPPLFSSSLIHTAWV